MLASGSFAAAMSQQLREMEMEENSLLEDRWGQYSPGVILEPLDCSELEADTAAPRTSRGRDLAERTLWSTETIRESAPSSPGALPIRGVVECSGGSGWRSGELYRRIADGDMYGSWSTFEFGEKPRWFDTGSESDFGEGAFDWRKFSRRQYARWVHPRESGLLKSLVEASQPGDERWNAVDILQYGLWSDEINEMQDDVDRALRAQLGEPSKAIAKVCRQRREIKRKCGRGWAEELRRARPSSRCRRDGWVARQRGGELALLQAIAARKHSPAQPPVDLQRGPSCDQPRRREAEAMVAGADCFRLSGGSNVIRKTERHFRQHWKRRTRAAESGCPDRRLASKQRPSLRLRGGCELFVKTLSGQTIVLRLDLSATAGDLKASIREATGVPQDALRLICRSRELGGRSKAADEATLGDCGLSSGAVVFMLLRLRGGGDDTSSVARVRPAAAAEAGESSGRVREDAGEQPRPSVAVASASTGVFARAARGRGRSGGRGRSESLSVVADMMSAGLDGPSIRSGLAGMGFQKARISQLMRAASERSLEELRRSSSTPLMDAAGAEEGAACERPSRWKRLALSRADVSDPEVLVPAPISPMDPPAKSPELAECCGSVPRKRLRGKGAPPHSDARRIGRAPRQPPFVPVPPDGLCMAYVAMAARDVGAWMAGRDANGWLRDAARERAEALEARRLIELVAECYESEGDAENADRLRMAGSAGYPGTDEIPYLALLLGGRIEQVDFEHPDVPVITFGTCGPVLFRIAHQIIEDPGGSKASHWVLAKTYMGRPAEPVMLDDVVGEGGCGSGEAADGAATGDAPEFGSGGQDIPQRALCVKKLWLDLMLAGSKTIEIRGKRHSYAGELVYLVETKTGLVRAIARFEAARPLHQAEEIENSDALAATGYKYPFAWPVTIVVRLKEPLWAISAEARKYCPSWVPRSRWESYPSAGGAEEPVPSLSGAPAAVVWKRPAAAPERQRAAANPGLVIDADLADESDGSCQASWQEMLQDAALDEAGRRRDSETEGDAGSSDEDEGQAESGSGGPESEEGELLDFGRDKSDGEEERAIERSDPSDNSDAESDGGGAAAPVEAVAGAVSHEAVPSAPSRRRRVTKGPAMASQPLAAIRRRLKVKTSSKQRDIVRASVTAGLSGAMSQQADAERRRDHRCHGEQCRYSLTETGRRGSYQGANRFCMWCCPELLSKALTTIRGRGSVKKALKLFHDCDAGIFEEAVRRLPTDEAVFLPLSALGAPSFAFRSAFALERAVSTPARRTNLLGYLRRVRSEDAIVFRMASAALPEAHREAVLGAVLDEPRRASRARRRSAQGGASWEEVLTSRKRALAAPTEEELAEHAIRAVDDKTHARRRFFPARASTWLRTRDVEMPMGLDEADIPTESLLPPVEDVACDETGLPNVKDMSASAESFQDWCKRGSWIMCEQCRSLKKRRLQPVDMRRAAAAQVKKCGQCKAGTGYAAPQLEDRPRRLQNLTAEILEALRPLSADPGPHERASQGYRVHTAMTRLLWSEHSVKEKIKRLQTHAARRTARKALSFLKSDEASSYAAFYEKHKRFLSKQARASADATASGGDDGEDAQASASQIPISKRRLPLGAIETVGVECAMWPHLYWTTEMCETFVRSSDVRRRTRRRAAGNVESASSESDAAESSDGENAEKAAGRQSLKGSYVAKVLSPVIGYGSDYGLFQFVYDLHMWTSLGSKKHIRQGAVPMRILLRGASFSPLYWRLRHNALIDLQRQIGYPTLFYTMSPYEWSFPYHAWIVDELNKDLKTRLHLPAAETMHLAHALMELAQGWLLGASSSSSSQAWKNWNRQILKGHDGRSVIVNYCARLEFQDGKRKRPPKHNYEAGGTGGRNWGRGAVHLHLLVWTEGGDLSCLQDTLSGTVPVGDPIMTGYVLGSQASWGASGWREHSGPTTVDDAGEALLLEHTQTDALNGLRAYFPDVTKATKGSHQDALQTDGRGLLLKYVSSYVPKFSDDFATEWLDADDSVSGHRIASKILFDYHPQEPDMWLQLAAQQFPVFKMGGSIVPILAPYCGMPKKSKEVELYEASEWRGESMSFLEFLRKTNKHGRPMRYIVEAFKRERGLRPRALIDEVELEAFARDYRTRGEKLVAADTVWRLNDRYYGEWLALHVPFRKLEDLRDEAVVERVPERYRHLATALQRCSEYWRQPGLADAIADMKLEAVNSTQIDTVVAMIAARTHLIDKFLAGRIVEEQEDPPKRVGFVTEAMPHLQYDGQQEMLSTFAKRSIEETVRIQNAAGRGEIRGSDSDGEGREDTLSNAEIERLVDKRKTFEKPIAVLGPPGSGKTTVAKSLIAYAKGLGGEVLFAFPTGQMQSRLRSELQGAGLEVDCDTCHGAFQLHKMERDALPVLDQYTLIIVDEFPQLSRAHFDRIVNAWDTAGRLPVLLFLGDFHQLPSIEGTSAKDSSWWKRMHRVSFSKCWRSGDPTLVRKLSKLRKTVPNRRWRNAILRGHKAWNHAGPPTAADLRKLYRDTGGRTTIVTCTRRAAQQVNEVAAEVLVGRRRVLASLPADYDANLSNYDDRGKLLKDSKPTPSGIEIRKGLKLHLTKNIDKRGDFVNGMECTVQAWDAGSRCLHVKTVTGKNVDVFQYTDPNPEAQGASYYPIRLGYASTIYKMQGAELPHVTIWLDRPRQRAAAYVAMSRVKSDGDYAFGGKYTKLHFLPNA